MIFNVKIKVVGDWGLGIGDCNPQSPIPNPHYYVINHNQKIYLK